MRLIIICLISLTLLSCSKEEPEWEWCEQCTMEMIAGTYTGKANSSRYQFRTELWEDTKDIDITITISGSARYMNVLIYAPGYYYHRFVNNYTNSYYLTDGDIFNATIWKQDDQLKLVGVCKNYSVGLVIQVVDFVVFQQPDS
ncbi:MAG: hypothetical protein WCR58_06475 [Bacteroidales bacterium]|nr:hypothetical protein [Bacteroidales bacterium]MDD3702197.1 hypothetical protein [Bacteroidales bacterium]MDY0368929.1 hypothetical protein [Bacteroidales bacterium]